MTLRVDKDVRAVVSEVALAQFRQQVEERLAEQRNRSARYEVDKAIDADPVTWIMENFYIPETGRPMELYPAQEIPMREALSRDANGNFRYSTVLWSAIKKSAKSSIAAAVGMWFAFRKPYSSIKVLGNDLKQAESRVYEYMRRAVLLREDWKGTIKVNNYKMTFPNGSTIEAIPVDPTGEAGGNDDLLLYTELWGWKSTKHQQMWSETTLSPTKYGKSLRWCESYAGFSGEAPVLEQLYTNAVMQGRVVDAEYEIYANDASRLFALWMTKPSLPWQTPEYYAQESASLAPSEFARIHQNQWVSSEQSFLEDISLWDMCKGEIPPLLPEEMEVAGMDAAVSSDTFGIVLVSRRGEQFYIRRIRSWEPRGGQKINFAEPEQYIRDYVRDNKPPIEWAYDPYQLHDMATRLQREGVGWFKPFQQGQPRLIADKHLYDLIAQRRIVHDGDPVLREHIANANRKEDGDKLRIVKRADHLKIDLVICVSMACYEARRLNIG